MMTIKANISYLFSNCLFSFSVIIATLYLLGDYLIHFIIQTENYNYTIRQLPIKIQFPFDIQQTQSPIFEFIAVAIFLHAILQVSAIAILNGLIFTLVIYIAYLLFWIFYNLYITLSHKLISVNVVAQKFYIKWFVKFC